MNWIIGFCLLLLLLLVWMLIAPIILRIDTNSALYEFQWRGLIKSQLILYNDKIVVSSKLIFWKKDIDLLEQGRQKKKKRLAIKRRKAKWLNKGKRVLKTFNIKSFKLNVDTGDYALNGLLFPVFYYLGRGRENMIYQINFNDGLSLHLEVENRLYKILLALINF